MISLKRILKWIGIIVSGLILILIILASIYYKKYSEHVKDNNTTLQSEHPKVGSFAPDYTLYLDTIGSGKTIPVKLNEIRGKVVLLFWYSKCPGAKDLFPILGELSNKYRDKLLVYIISDYNEIPVLDIKNKYPELNLCRIKGRIIKYKENVFPYPNSYHTVLLDKKGKIRAYNFASFLKALTEKLVLDNDFSEMEKATIKILELYHKIDLELDNQNEILIYQKANLNDSISFNYSDLNRIIIHNKSGFQIYEEITGIKKRDFNFNEVDTSVLATKYNFVYGIATRDYFFRKGGVDNLRLQSVFKDSTMNKLNNIFNLNATIVISNLDTTIVFQ
jgi:thiol-disulfide isomerase/thioredoxin